jgi:hypothetical protein
LGEAIFGLPNFLQKLMKKLPLSGTINKNKTSVHLFTVQRRSMRREPFPSLVIESRTPSSNLPYEFVISTPLTLSVTAFASMRDGDETVTPLPARISPGIPAAAEIIVNTRQRRSNGSQGSLRFREPYECKAMSSRLAENTNCSVITDPVRKTCEKMQPISSLFIYQNLPDE